MNLRNVCFAIFSVTLLSLLTACDDSDSTVSNTDFSPNPNIYYKVQSMFLENDNKCLEGNRLSATSTLGGASFMDTCSNASGQFWRFEAISNGYYKLKTLFLESENRCLEGNRLDAASTLQGAAFMDRCQNVTGQEWIMREDAKTPGYYRMQTSFLEAEDKCFEGNTLDPSATLEGASFMDTCQDVTGQLWKFVETTQTVPTVTFTPNTNVYYKLQTAFLIGDNKCLEGNKIGANATLGGATFMDNCQTVTGQSWKFVDIGNGYYHLQTQFTEGDNLCLEGNLITPTSELGGASFMAPCGNFSGQAWKILADDDTGYFRLQTQGLENDNRCLEGNKLDPASTLEGASFMDTCQDVSGQLWIFSTL